MTREEAIKILKQRECCRECVADCTCNECDKAFEMAIKALEQEPCEDAVSRAEAINKLKEHYFDEKLQSVKDEPCVIDAMTDLDIRIIKALPPAEPTRKKGKWIKVTETEFGIGYKCSECGRFILTESIDGRKLKDYPYCHCGAEMEREE